MILYILRKENKAPYPHFFDNLDNEKNREALSSTEEPPSLVDKRKVCHKLSERNMERWVEEWTDKDSTWKEISVIICPEIGSTDVFNARLFGQ